MKLNWRIIILNTGFLLVGLMLLARLFYWQVLASEQLVSLAESQQQSIVEIPARRGEILFADGSYLAANQPSYIAYLIREPNRPLQAELSEKLSPLLYENLVRSATPSAFLTTESKKSLIEAAEDELNQRLNNLAVTWISLGRKLSAKQKTALEALDLGQTHFESDEKRFYPEASMAAHLIGFVGQTQTGADAGYHGLEGYYQAELAGRAGIIRQEKDAFNNPILMGQFALQQKKDGRQLKLSIDKSLQYQVEKKLAKAVDQFGAKAGSVTIMDPKTGSILAMASLPSYDPKEYYNFSPSLYLNPVVNDAFEPGSIFKVMVMASALDAGVIEADTICDICDGPVKVDKYTINTWDNKYRPNSPMTDIIVNSDNVGMVFIGRKLGLDNFLQYFHRFGLSEKTGIDLQDEVVPAAKPDNQWTFVDLATASFGQGFVVTSMQILQAVSAIANDGEMMVPRLVTEVIGDGKVLTLPPKSQGRVVSKQAADLVTDMMVAAAKDGEAKWTATPGYSIAGKTGTAQVAVEGKYDTSKTNASFVGFAPANDPKFAMLVTLKEPSTSQWASETAAPLWFGIAQDVLNHFNVIPSVK